MSVKNVTGSALLLAIALLRPRISSHDYSYARFSAIF